MGPSHALGRLRAGAARFLLWLASKVNGPTRSPAVLVKVRGSRLPMKHLGVVSVDYHVDGHSGRAFVELRDAWDNLSAYALDELVYFRHQHRLRRRNLAPVRVVA